MSNAGKNSEPGLFMSMMVVIRRSTIDWVSTIKAAVSNVSKWPLSA